MKRRLFCFRLMLCVGLCLGLQATAWSAIAIKPPTASRTYLRCDCEAGNEHYCSTTLDYPLKHADTPSDGDAFDKLIEAAYPGWTITYGGELSGEIKVTTYDAYTCSTFWKATPATEHCIHGAWFEFTFTKAGTDPDPPSDQSYHLVQRFKDWGGYCGYTTAPHDVIDCTAGEGPYYWTPTEEAGHSSPTWFQDLPHAGCYHEEDECPGDECPKPCHWGADVWTYVAIGTPGALGTGTMTVYDGVRWGFTADCVIPEPSTFVIWAVLLGLALSPTLIRRRAGGRG